MNWKQIICPLVAVLVFGIPISLIHGRGKHSYYVLSQTGSIGRELIAQTNSARLVRLGSGLEQKLSEFLASPTQVDKVLMGDEPTLLSDQRATSRLFLRNERQEVLGIRLRRDTDAPDRFHVLGYWTVQRATDEHVQ